ncbi:MAG: C-terminal binding protein [Eubacteriales bacterium]|nr:C-terminal binding protein [Eubacteriales bacterium]
MSKKVIIINAYYPDYEVEKSILSEFGAEVSHVDTGKNLQRTIEAARFADAVMTRETELPRQFIESLEKCRVIVRYGVGVDNIDLAAAKERGIYVANVGDYGTETVAEHAVALMFAVARRITVRDADVRNGAWDIGAAEPLYSFVGKTLGVAGCGKIGRAFIRKASALGFERILGFDPYVSALEGVEMTDMRNLLSSSDIISLHMPLTDENRHIINSEVFGLMKRKAILVNTSRGGLIDEAALVDALREDRIFGAGIDVYEHEPPYKDNPLFKLKNVTLSDHTGWYSVDSLALLQRKAALEVARVFKGEQPNSWVNRW